MTTFFGENCIERATCKFGTPQIGPTGNGRCEKCNSNNFYGNNCLEGVCSKVGGVSDGGITGSGLCISCREGFLGRFCDEVTNCLKGVPDYTRASVGNCLTCDTNYYGPTCSKLTSCDTTNGVANDGIKGDQFCKFCKGGFWGDFCDRESECSSDRGNVTEGVNGNGKCTSCKPGYFGETCQPVTCQNGKALDGVDGAGTCSECEPDAYGENCDSCKCSMFGVCNAGLAGNGTCDCDVGFGGELCEISCDDECADTCTGQGPSKCAGKNPDGKTECANWKLDDQCVKFCDFGWVGDGATGTCVDAAAIAALANLGEDSNPTVIIASAAVGGLLFCILVAVICMVCCGCCGFACANKAKEERRNQKIKRLFSYRRNELGDVDNSNSRFTWNYNGMPGSTEPVDLDGIEAGKGGDEMSTRGSVIAEQQTPKWTANADDEFDVGLDESDYVYEPVTPIRDSKLSTQYDTLRTIKEEDTEGDAKLAAEQASRELVYKALRVSEEELADGEQEDQA